MNILIFNWRDPKNPKAGGAEYVTFAHAKAWVKNGHQVTWFTSHFSTAKTKEVIDGVSIIRKGSPYTVHLLAPFFYFFSGKKFDIVIDEIHGIPFFTPLYVRKPKIAFIHEVAEEIWDYMYPFPINVIGRYIEKVYFNFYKHVRFWTDAPSTINDLVRFGIKRKNCIAIPCPINNATVNKPVKKEVNPTYIFVSRLVKMKGIENVLKAFQLIQVKDKQAKLWIVGDGEKKYSNSLKKMAKKFGIEKNVIFHGFVSTKRKLELLKKAHLLLHASVKEGWGLVVLEAASQATPAVVYNVSGLCDVVQNGKTGIVISNNTPEEMAKESIKLLRDTNRYQKLQKNGLSFVKNLKWSEVTQDSLNYLLKGIKK